MNFLSCCPQEEEKELQENVGEVKNFDKHETNFVEKDGVTWAVTRGRPPTTPELEDHLAEVKALYKMKYGKDVDDEEDDDEEQTHEHETNYVENDGIMCAVTRGRPPMMSELEDKLAEVKSLYKRKYGEDVDDEEDEEEEQLDEHEIKYVEKDGVTWAVTRGRPPTMSELEDKLAEVKSLYKTKYGEDMDDEEDEEQDSTDDQIQYVEKDGITWEVTR